MTFATHENGCCAAARDYMERLGWVLVPVRGPGTRRPKAPVYTGWPQCRPAWGDLAELLEHRPKAGIALNLGASGLIDLEADTAEGEALLDELCAGATFPCWRAKRGKHRLFNDPRVVFMQTEDGLKVEFRAGEHVSILPPSFHASGQARYEWVVSPFDVQPPPLPERLYQFYLKHPPKEAPRQARDTGGGPRARTFPFRDHLDYVLRHFDLMERAAQAGMVFVYKRADANGNAPCFVPDALRDGNPDDYPSGVFNIYSGRLTDFASRAQYRFFDLMAALTGRPWRDVFEEFRQKARVQGRRPHSYRISIPAPEEEPAARAPLDEARANLRDYFRAELSRPPVPRRLHIIKGPPGLGKTYALCEELAAQGRKAVLLTLENRLAEVHARLINQAGGGNARRMPILRETACPSPDEYEAVSRLGYQPSKSSPCLGCPIGPRRCEYLIAFSTLADADQLCCAGVYHTHQDFYASYGNEDRPVVVFDENCVDLLLAPHAHGLADWRAWGKLLAFPYRRGGKPMPGSVRRVLDLVKWLARTGNAFLEGRAAHQAFAVPEALKRKGLLKRPSLEAWLNQRARRGRRRLPPNLYDAAISLLTEPTACVLLERVRRRGRDKVLVRFRRRHLLPEGKEVFVLDATANEELIRAVAPGWEVKVWQCPPVAQAGRVVQVMDYDVSRAFVRRELRRHRKHAPCWLVQVLDAILAGTESSAFISFKAVATARQHDLDVLGQITHGGKIATRLHFPCRGINVDANVLIVAGTPYKNQTTVLELALAVYGLEGLPRAEYARRERQDGHFVASNMSYGDPRLDAIEQFVVSADLGQAVGRARPLQRQATVYVLSNAPLPDWQVTQVCASELFDLRKPLRSDAAARYDAYVDEAIRQLDLGWVSNADVSKAAGVTERTGRNFWRRLKEEYRDRIEIRAHKVTWKKP